jgi:FG-GAP repeat
MSLVRSQEGWRWTAKRHAGPATVCVLAALTAVVQFPLNATAAGAPFRPGLAKASRAHPNRHLQTSADVNYLDSKKNTVFGPDSSRSSLGALGTSVAILGNTIMAGAPDQNDFAGAVFIYVRSDGKWRRQAKISDPTDAGGDGFGTSVALSKTRAGLIAIIGNTGGDGGQGVAYIFTRSGGIWHRQARLTDPHSGPRGGANFGCSVAISGTTAVVGANAFWAKKPAIGNAYVFSRSASGWHLQARLSDPGAHRGGLFGDSVAIQGRTIVIGATDASYGAMFEGEAYVFARSTGIWRRQATIRDPGRQRWAGFGESPALSGDTLVIGADGASDEDGDAYVFVRTAASWRLRAKLADPVPGSLGGFGFSQAIEGKTMLISAPWGGDKACGVVYVYTGSGQHWRESATLVEAHCVNMDEFGFSLAISGRTAVISARLKHGNSGELYTETIPEK